jgi:hypothetical protein
MPHTRLHYLKHVLELFSSRADEKYSRTTATELERAVKVHDPMLWLVGWGFHLVFSPFHHEIDQCL